MATKRPEAELQEVDECQAHGHAHRIGEVRIEMHEAEAVVSDKEEHRHGKEQDTQPDVYEEHGVGPARRRFMRLHFPRFQREVGARAVDGVVDDDRDLRRRIFGESAADVEAVHIDLPPRRKGRPPSPRRS